MKRVSIYLLLAGSALPAAGQDLLARIPHSANVVASFNSAKLLQMMPLEEWNNSIIGKKLLEMRSKSSGDTLRSLGDFGIDLNQSVYYYHTENDSLQYNVVLLPVSDGAKLEAVLQDRPVKKSANDLRSLADPDSTGFAMWNNQQLVYVKGILKESYFQRPDIAMRHGLTTYQYNVNPPVVSDTSFSQIPPPDSSVVQLETSQAEMPVYKAPAAKKSTPVRKNPAVKKTLSKKSGPKTKPVKNKKNSGQIPESLPGSDSTVTLEQPRLPEITPEDNYAKDDMIKKKIAASCTGLELINSFTKPPDTSIRSNAQFMKSVDATAVASIWLDKPMELYYNLIPRNFMYGNHFGGPFKMPSNNFWYKNLTTKLFVEKNQLRLSYAVDVNDEMAVMQKAMFNRTLNKKFLDYINSDSLLGYMSWAIDTKAYLENFPKMLESTYGALGLGLGGEEYGVLSELISFLLDEDAVSQLVKGDALVLFNGLYQQETTYTDYVYDENYKASEVQKHKTDTLPRFLMMVSSDVNNFERKLIQYGIRKNVVKEREGFYEIEVPKSPIGLYFLNKDGIFFLSNSLANIRDINTGHYKSLLSKDEKKFLLEHNYTLYFDPAKTAGQLGTTQIGAAESLSAAMNTLRKMGTVRAAMKPIQSNQISGDLIMDVPTGNQNGLKYIFSLFDGLLK